MTNNDPRNIFVANRDGYVDEHSDDKPRGGNNGFSGGNNAEPNRERTSAERSQNAFGGGYFGDGGSADNRSKGTERRTDKEGTSGADYETRVAEMKRLAAKYQREGEGQLVKDIVNNVIEQKAAGKLTNQQLIAFANRVAPLLNADQKQRLSELVEQLLKV